MGGWWSGGGRDEGPAPALYSDEPIYAELAATWHAEGRMVPGQVDEQWDVLCGLETKSGAGSSWAVSWI